MRACGWQHGAGTEGLALSRADRDPRCDPICATVRVDLPKALPVFVPLTDACWDECSEFRHPRLGCWCQHHGLAPWPAGQSPRCRRIQGAPQHVRLGV
jgi:hypothetical protein